MNRDDDNQRQPQPPQMPHREADLANLDEFVDEHGGAVPAGGAAELASGMESEFVREEISRLATLHRLLAQQRVSVGPDFTEAVMGRVANEMQRSRASSARLAPSSRSWVGIAVLAAALLSVLAVLSRGLVTTEGPAATLADFMVTAVSAGAGLLGATWSGVGTITASWFEASPFTLIACGIAFVAAQALLLRSWRRRRAPASHRRDG